jgi:hypothetical protein
VLDLIGKAVELPFEQTPTFRRLDHATQSNVGSARE